MTKLSDEFWLNAMMKRAGLRTDAFEGLTTSDTRKAIFRAAITDNDMGAKDATRGETFAVLFQRTYGEPLGAAQDPAP